MYERMKNLFKSRKKRVIRLPPEYANDKYASTTNHHQSESIELPSDSISSSCKSSTSASSDSGMDSRFQTIAPVNSSSMQVPIDKKLRNLPSTSNAETNSENEKHFRGARSFSRLERNDDSKMMPILLDRLFLDEVAEFYHQFPDLHTEIRIMIMNNVTVYLLGTNHADPQCPLDVAKIMRKLKPETTLVELCAWRACGCERHRGNIFQTKPDFSFRYLRRVISQIGFLPAMIFFTDAFNEHLASERNYLEYGGEFAVAAQICQDLGSCKLILADREIPITVKRQASAMSNWRGLRVSLFVTLSLFFKSHLRSFLLRAHKLVIRDRHFYQVVVLERDIFLAYMIQAVASLPYSVERPQIVAVVGQGHLHGIQNFWGSVAPQILPMILQPEIDL